jgi:hypothetical protein
MLRITGTAAVAVTLMACYGDGDYYDCYDDPQCNGDPVCYDNDDCTGGYSCDTFSNRCEWQGWCVDDVDCGDGFICDYRDTCVPGERDPDPCTSDEQCNVGEVCEESTGDCYDTGTCTTDEECEVLGDDVYCNTERTTCEPCPDEGCPVDPGFCDGPVTCEDDPPACELDFSPGILDGCYTGECIADAECTSYCGTFDNEVDCDAAEECESTYNGVNCTDPNGGPCTDPATECTCESFVFDECVQLPPPADDPPPSDPSSGS